jgi:hypothetical protein
LPATLANAGIRLIVAMTFAESIVFGTLYIAVPAFASSHHDPSASEVLLGVMNVGALCGGLVSLSGRQPWTRWLATGV